MSTMAPQLLDHCVSYVQFAAFVGDADLSATWNAAGQDTATLRCPYRGSTETETASRANDSTWRTSLLVVSAFGDVCGRPRRGRGPSPMS